MTPLSWARAGSLFVNFDRAGKEHRLTGAAVYHIVGWLGAKAGLRSAARAAPSRDHHRTRPEQRRCARVAKFSRHQDLRTLSRYRDNRRDLAGKLEPLSRQSEAGCFLAIATAPSVEHSAVLDHPEE